MARPWFQIPRAWTKRLVLTLSGVRWIALILAACATGVVKTAWTPPLAAIALVFEWTKANNWWVLPVLPTIAVLCQWGEARIQFHERLWSLFSLLDQMLGILRTELIPLGLSTEPESHHRLTLFRANSRCTKLTIVARSGEATHDSRTEWRIDPNDEKKCQGIAGMAWFLGTHVVVPGANEPDLPELTSDTSENHLSDYARRTMTTIEDCRQQLWAARSYAALQIRVSGRRWGVLVLDSRDPKGARDRIIRQKAFAAEMLGDIIKHWEQS